MSCRIMTSGMGGYADMGFMDRSGFQERIWAKENGKWQGRCKFD